MKKSLLILFLFVYSFVLGQQSKPDPVKPTYKPFVISSDTLKKYDISPFIQFIADTANQYSIEQVSSLAFANKFIPVANRIISKTHWMRFTIKSNLNYDKEWLLSIEGNNESIYLVYIPDVTGKIIVKKLGNIPLKERDFKHGGVTAINCLFRGEQEQTIYVKRTSDDKESLWAAVELKNKDTVLENMSNTRLINGIFLGIFLIMIIYNAILYISIKERSYLYYVLYIFFFALFIISATGLGFEFLWSNHPYWSNYIKGIAVISFLNFYVGFGKTYLNTKKHLLKWNKAIDIQIIGLSISAGLMFIIDRMPDWVQGIMGTMLVVFAVSSFIILLIPAILCIRKGISHARYFLFGNIMVVLGAGLMLFSAIAGVPSLAGISMYMGVTMEIIIFSIGIGAKVNGLTKDKVKAQEETIAQLEENEKLKDKVNRELEQKVSERTAEVVKQKEIIEEQNKEVTDSINYAKRIQQAKLPKKEEIYSAFPNCFVLFKPKDIVSGDFYFFHKNKQSVFIAAADCTGHGVPGAFMSMIGSERLEDAVSQSMDTSEILNLLNKGIKTSLRQSDSDESTRDGMDIALCSVDTVNYIVKYAGANRPLYIIRKGQTEIEEIKATKKAIGGLTVNDQHFDTHELKLQQGDTFYISTDGYADQFSGQDKKLTTKKFKQILIDIQDKTMQEQEIYLDNFIENWKTGIEQIDDILVIGVKL